MARQNQIAKIKQDEVLREGVAEIVIPSQGGEQKSLCLRYDLVPMWLAMIHPSKVKPEYRNKIILYRKEVAKVLAEYFLGNSTQHGFAFDKTVDFMRHLKQAVKTALQEISLEIIQQTVEATLVKKPEMAWLTNEYKNALEFASLSGLEGNEARLAASKAIKNLYNLKREPLALLEINLISKEQGKLLTATELSKLAGIKNAQIVNKKLESLGLQISYRDHKKRIGWRLTQKAIENKYAQYVDTNKKHSNGTSIQQIKWYEKVLEVLK